MVNHLILLMLSMGFLNKVMQDNKASKQGHIMVALLIRTTFLQALTSKGINIKVIFLVMVYLSFKVKVKLMGLMEALHVLKLGVNGQGLAQGVTGTIAGKVKGTGENMVVTSRITLWG